MVEHISKGYKQEPEQHDHAREEDGQATTLFKLPKELLNSVYTWALTYASPIMVSADGRGRIRPSPPAMAQATRHWIDLARPDLRHIQRIKVHHRRRDFGFHGEQPALSYHETVKFTIVRTSDGHLDLQDLGIVPDKICGCAIEDLAVKHRQKDGETALCNPVVAMMVESAHLVNPGPCANGNGPMRAV
ncbi:hypothetical protein LTR86_005780 [Recurvomyces mirabilis]|nr:hypothetical protein LTR86_005780 [Recurvomyces mirabilis]